MCAVLPLPQKVHTSLISWRLQKASLNRRASPVLLPNRRRIRTPSPGLPEGSLSPPLSPLHDGLAALHEAATSPERQARALAAAAAAAIPRFYDVPQVSGVWVQVSWGWVTGQWG